MKDKNYALAVELRHTMHMYPELSNHETETIKLITKYIENNTDFKVTNMGAYIYVDYHVNDGKYTVYRADIDALNMVENIDKPYNSKNTGVAHKCGHDGHASTLFAFLLEVSEKRPDKNILFLFQHAEETGDGAKECVKLLEQYDIEVVYGYHNMSGIKYKAIGAIYDIAHLGSYGMEVNFFGKTSHASEPEKGINPAKAISELVLNLDNLVTDAMYTVVHINLGQSAFGISAGSGKVMLTIRSDKDSALEEARDRIVDFTGMLSEKYSLQNSFEYHDYFPVTYNHKKSVDNIISAAKRLGFDIDMLKEPYRASEDFGVYTKGVKGAIFYIGNGEDYPSIHTDDYDFRDELIRVGADMFMNLLEM